MSRENGSLFPGVQREGDSKQNQTLKRTVTIKALKHRQDLQQTGWECLQQLKVLIYKEKQQRSLKKQNKTINRESTNTTVVNIIITITSNYYFKQNHSTAQVKINVKKTVITEVGKGCIFSDIT